MRELPIPAPDEVTSEMERTVSQSSLLKPSDATLHNQTIPIGPRSQSYQSDRSTTLVPHRPSSSFPANSNTGPGSSTNLFRGRAKTLASLAGPSKSVSSSPHPQEVQLPKDPYVNRQPLEAVLYKDASECPICFLYYPPYLNRTRCCDQPICSECFVQIKRPDPHQPEHHDDPANPTPPPPPEEEGLLVSEPSACPFCVTPEFGVTYEPPAFRRGLIYAGPASAYPASRDGLAIASSSSLNAPGQGRRRTTSLSANASQVITTDRVRPDWAKKLADARAHALRRSAAATALHNAAYVLGNNQASDSRGFALGRRRRALFSDSPAASGSGTPTRLPDSHPLSHLSSLILQTDRHGSSADRPSSRSGARQSRVQDLEDLMMMEAIRLSLASEEDRKKKEDKEAKKEEKKKAKDVKKTEKSTKKGSGLYSASNASTSTWTSMARSTSNLGQPSTSPPPPPPSQGKGKAPITAKASKGFNPLDEPTSTLNTEMAESSSSAVQSNTRLPSEDPQRHLEEQRANLQQPQPSQPISLPNNHRAHLRHLSNASSAASSLLDSGAGSYQRSSETSPNASGLKLDETGDANSTPDYFQSPTPGNTGTEPMFNFRSLAAMIGEHEKASGNAEHVEHVPETCPEQQSQEKVSCTSTLQPTETTRSRGDSGESEGGSSGSSGSSDSSSAGPPSLSPPAYAEGTVGDMEIEAVPAAAPQSLDQKHHEDTAVDAPQDQSAAH